MPRQHAPQVLEDLDFSPCQESLSFNPRAHSPAKYRQQCTENTKYTDGTY